MPATRTDSSRRDLAAALLFAVLSVALYFLPTGFEGALQDTRSERVRATVLETDDSDVLRHGIVKTGDQHLLLRIENGRFQGEVVTSNNPLLGMMDRDTLFEEGDSAFVTLTLSPDEERIVNAAPESHYRLDLELLLLGLFAGALLLFGGLTGAKALLSFLFAALMLWRVLVPLLLKGWDPVWLALGVVAVMTAAIIFLVGGVNRKGLTAFLGAFLGILTSAALAVFFTGEFAISGAVMPFSEPLLYAGFAHLDLSRIYMAAVFLAASGAVMDLAMDVSASLHEVVCKKPDISFTEALKSGISVGRAVVGTMTTTLLLAYSGGFLTLLMAFMAKGVPLANFFNVVYVAAEILKTLVGSFGLVMVAPFTALIGAWIFTRRPECLPGEAEQP
ncbi:YibE/F family protein [Desulfohalovibrio reitneri]|uniref:YibE/F family protein n=1 Tax=Desulfohalovibrio reitneri TaxID=1307759 RepID=UPI0005502338|nr:YibE/F family protein [Desulfohalovibrio reitneri]